MRRGDEAQGPDGDAAAAAFAAGVVAAAAAFRGADAGVDNPVPAAGVVGVEFVGGRDVLFVHEDGFADGHCFEEGGGDGGGLGSGGRVAVVGGDEGAGGGEEGRELGGHFLVFGGGGGVGVAWMGGGGVEVWRGFGVGRLMGFEVLWTHGGLTLG